MLYSEEVTSADVVLLAELLYITKYLEKINKKIIEINNTTISRKIKLINSVLRTINTISICGNLCYCKIK